MFGVEKGYYHQKPALGSISHGKSIDLFILSDTGNMSWCTSLSCVKLLCPFHVHHSNMKYMYSGLTLHVDFFVAKVAVRSKQNSCLTIQINGFTSCPCCVKVQRFGIIFILIEEVWRRVQVTKTSLTVHKQECKRYSILSKPLISASWWQTGSFYGMTGEWLPGPARWIPARVHGVTGEILPGLTRWIPARVHGVTGEWLPGPARWIPARVHGVTGEWLPEPARWIPARVHGVTGEWLPGPARWIPVHFMVWQERYQQGEFLHEFTLFMKLWI